MLYANAVKALYKAENFSLFILNPRNNRESSQKNRHDSPASGLI